MGGNELMMSLRLQLAEKVSGPLKNITQASQINAKALRANRDQLRALERQSGLIQRLKQQQEAFKRASNEMRTNQANLNALKLSGAATAAQIKAQTALVDKSTLAFTRQKDRLFELRSAATAAGIGKLSDDEKRLADSISRTTQQIQQQEGALKRLDQLREQRNRALAVTAGIGGAGLALRMAGNRGLNASRNLMASSFEFDAAMADLQGKFNLSSESAELQALREHLKSFYQEDLVDLTTGLQTMAQQGFSMQQAMAGIPTLIAAADAAGMSQADAAASFAGVMKGFNLSFDDFAQTSDMLVAASGAGNIALDQLNASLASIAPQARASGFSLQETAAMLGALNQAGINAEDSVTSLQAVMRGLQSPNTKALAAIGIRPGDAKNMQELLALVSQKTAGMGDLKQLEALSNIFGSKNAAMMQQLMTQMRGGGFDEVMNQINNSQGATTKLATQNTNHLQDATEDLQHSLGNIRQEVADLNKEWLRELAISVTAVIGSIRAWIKENPRLVATLSKFFMIGSAIMAVVGTLMVAFAAMAAPAIMFKFAIMGLSVKGFGLIGMLKGLFTLLRAHPFGLLIAAIAFAASAIYANWDAIVWFFKDTWDNIKTFFSSGIANIAATIINWSPIGLFHKAFAAVLSWFGIDLPGDFGAAAVGMITGFGEGVLGMAGWLWDTVTGVFSGVFDWFADMPARFMEMGGQVMSGLVDGIKGAAGAVKDAVVNTAESVVGWFKGILGIKSPSRVFMAAGLNISEGAAIGITNGLPRVKRATEALGNEALPRFRADTRAPIGSIAAAAARSAPVAYGGNSYEIHIHGAQHNEQQIARMVVSEIEKYERSKQARARSSYHD